MIPDKFKPLLAIDHNKVKTQPKSVHLSEKLDGIRCVIFDGVPYSRSLKPIPNRYIQEYVKNNAEGLEGVDCEIIIGDKNAPDVFNKTTSGCMSFEGEPDFTMYCFDKYGTGPWLERFHNLVALERPARAVILDHYPVSTQEEIDSFERKFLSCGAEGVMLRDTYGDYKFGRSGTINPQIQKVKRFVDNEFLIIGWEPKYQNQNEPKINELGLQERSTAKAGMVPIDTMGALLLRAEDGTVFSCGSGFTDEIREDLWKRRESLMGQLAKVKYFDVGSGYVVPRFPIFIGIRSPLDT